MDDIVARKTQGVLMVLLLAVLLSAQHAGASEITTPSQNGVTITTAIDTINHTVVYGFDLAALPYNYEQIAFSPAPLPAFTGIPLEAGAVSSPGLTEWNFHQIFDGGTRIGWELELQYGTGSSLLDNTVTIHYNPDMEMSGRFVRLPGDDNITVTFREPITGFPDGQDDNVALWAYVPQIIPEPASLIPMLLGVVLVGRKRYLH